ncbi:hypothetical protein EYR38_001528 [Pleurotus pulmonarius]|nr:hypothetical protein EYR38_001528 [Pleurotus pulmonarius]
MPSTLTLQMAELAGMVVHSTMYGIYVVLFVGTIYALCFKHQTMSGRRYSRPINKILLSIAVILFVLISAQWLIQISRLFDAFIFIANPTQVYGSVRSPKNVIKTGLYIGQTVVSDITMVYRLFIVWNRSWRILIFPALITAGLIAAGINVVVSFARSPETPAAQLFANASSRWITIASTMSLALLIHIYLFRGFLFTAFVAVLVNHPFLFIVLDATSTAIGIAFSLIIVRVALGLGCEINQTTTLVRSRPELIYRSENQSFPFREIGEPPVRPLKRLPEFVAWWGLPEEEWNDYDVPFSTWLDAPASDEGQAPSKAEELPKSRKVGLQRALAIGRKRGMEIFRRRSESKGVRA